MMKNNHFPLWKELDSFEREWFSEHLHAAKEKPISLPVENNVYRFTWLRSFHHPIVVRVDCKEKCFLIAKQLYGAGGYSPGRVQKIDRRELTNEEVSELRILANKIDKWIYTPNEEIIGMDGAQWIFEKAHGNNYQAWNIWSPNGEKAADAYVEMCLYLLSLTSFTIEKSEVY